MQLPLRKENGAGGMPRGFIKKGEGGVEYEKAICYNILTQLEISIEPALLMLHFMEHHKP